MSVLPPQTKFIVGNEACERFSFYGMKSILMLYMTGTLLMTESLSMAIMHIFVGMIYLLPLGGAWLADKVWGRYKTILYISLLYCLGHGILATSDLFTSIEARQWVLLSGLFCIACGAGGIKPCVSSFMGDQIPEQDARTMTKAFNTFYWAINFGSFFSFLVIPTVQENYGYSWAFAIPGIAMALATFIFWLGRKRYLKSGPPHNPSRRIPSVIMSMIFRGKAATEAAFSEDSVADARHVLRIFSIFAFIIPFWSIFDQTASSWVVQGNLMRTLDIPYWPGHIFSIGAQEIQSINPVLIMVLIPLITGLIYPHIGKFAKPVVRLGIGLFISGLSFVGVAILQYFIDGGATLSIAWQMIPYVFLTVSEILVSTTGLELAYTQAPAHLKSTITSCWNLTIFLGNMLVALVSFFLAQPGQESVATPSRFLLYAGLVVIVGIFYALRIRRLRN